MALASADRSRFLAWVQHRGATWAALLRNGRPAAPLVGQLTTVDLRPGRYRVEWWDTHRGRITAARERDHAGGPMNLAWPEPLVDDLAMKIVPVP